MPTLTATTAPVSSPSTSLKFRNVSNSSPVSQFALLSEPVHEWIDSRQPVLYYPFQSVNRIVYQQTAAARLPLPQSNLPTHQFGQTVRHTAAPAGHHRHSLKSSAASATITSSRHRKGRVQQQSTHQHRSNHHHYNPQTVRTTGNGMSSSQSTTRTDDDLAMGATSNATDGCTPKSADFDEDLNSGPMVELVNGNGSASGTIEQSNGTGSGSNSSASSSTGRKPPTCRETVMLTKHVFEWSVDEVGSWLTLNHLEAYIELFCQQHRIDGRVLVNLSPEDLRAEPLALTVFGDIKRFCLAIGAIRDYYQVSEQHSRVRHSHEHSSTHRMVKSASGPSLRQQQQQRNHVQYQTFVKHPQQQQQQQPNLYSAAASSDSHFRNGQQSQHQRRSGNSKLSQSRAGGYSQLGKNANYRSQSASLFTSLQHEQQLPLDDSTEDDYDRGPEIMYDEEDDGEDDIDEVVIPQDREAAFFGAPEPQYVLSTNFQPYMPEGSEAGHHQPMSSTALYNSTRKRASVSDSGSLSDSSMSSDDSRDGSSASSSVSFTSMSKSESTALDSSSFPSVAKPIPINVYVPSHGASSNGRQIQAQIIPTVTSASQLANMAAYYSTAHQQQAYLRASQSGAPLHYNQAGSSSAYPSHFSNGSRMPPPTTTTTTKKSHKKRNHSTHHYRHGHHGHHRKAEFKPEAWKAIVAMLYFLGSTWVTAIVMVIVHDRVPDMDTYPPLPDILLDNLPLIPWAFGMCEFCGLVLFIIWSTILIFHKHRFILLRRMFSLFGSVFLLRCITMLITSLSVPGRHLECKARPYGSWLERINQAYLIWQGGGMSIQGVRTCGDYMFSGHTVVLTLMNFFITEYTPTKYYLVHTLSWVLNLFGIFFILSAHEHYSIDVFIAFYISTRLFLYYHTLANNRALYQRDRHRTRIWFPLFYFFESSVNGIVPNQYEVPFRKLKERLIAFVAAKFAARLVFGVPGIAHRQSMTPAQQQMNDEQGKLLTGDQKSASGTAKRTSSTASSSSQRSTSSVGNGQTVNHSSTKVKTQ